MINIAIVEDEDRDACLLKRLLGEYADAHGEEISVVGFSHPQDFLDSGSDGLDLVFLDICMPGYSGMEIARKIREHNRDLSIVFVTSMLQYAVEGYSVQASDFIVKPATAAGVCRVMDRVTEAMKRGAVKTVSVKDSVSGRMSVLKIDDILYVEVSLHKLTWHTRSGNIADWGTLDAVQSKLPNNVFSRCHVSYLVNLEHVKEVRKDTVIVGEDALPVSRSQKKNFYANLATYLGERR